MTVQSSGETQPAEKKLLLSIAEVSELLGLARSYTYRAFISTGRLPIISLGRRRLVARKDLEELVEHLRVDARTDAA